MSELLEIVKSYFIIDKESRKKLPRSVNLFSQLKRDDRSHFQQNYEEKLIYHSKEEYNLNHEEIKYWKWHPTILLGFFYIIEYLFVYTYIYIYSVIFIFK